MTRRRRLKPEEEELWERVKKSANPLRADAGKTLPALTNTTKRKQKQTQEPIAPFSITPRKAELPRYDLAPSISDHLNRQPVKIDSKKHKQLRRGKLVPEARIDLHGRTVAQAHPALVRFVLNAHGSGMRLVLVITGKGKDSDDSGPIPQRRGILRHQAPQWLTSGVLASVVLQVNPAHLKHGGEGAYYVYLRRQR